MFLDLYLYHCCIFQLKSTDIQTLIILLGKKIDEFLPLESTARVYSKNRFRIIFRKWK